MNIKEVAEMTGISVRTLHHYDDIGLLCPSRNDQNGYRRYSKEDLDLLQQILFFKECGFPLSKIQRLVSSSSFNKEEAFLLQKKYLLHEKKRINAMLDTLDNSLKELKGEIIMSSKEKFNGFDLSNNPYEAEARRLYGDEAVAHVSSLSKEEKESVSDEMGTLFERLSTLKDQPPESETVQKAMADMHRYFNTSFGYHYSPEAFEGLGQMYVADSRFTENIDRYGNGLSEFLSKAMAIYAKSLPEKS